MPTHLNGRTKHSTKESESDHKRELKQKVRKNRIKLKRIEM